MTFTQYFWVMIIFQLLPIVINDTTFQIIEKNTQKILLLVTMLNASARHNKELRNEEKSH